MNERVQPPELPASRTAQVMADIRGRIGAGQLVPNDRLPSIRRLAVELSVSPSTVVEAYDGLSAEGLIRPRPGSGFFVTEAGRTPAPLVRLEPPRAPEVDPFWVARQALDADPGTSKPGCGWLPPDWMPTALLHAGMRNVLRQATSLTTDYGPSRGSVGLRRSSKRGCVSNRLRCPRIRSCLRFRHPGARSRLPAVAAPRRPRHRRRSLLLQFPDAAARPPGGRDPRALYTENGPDIAAFEAAVAREAPRLYLTNSGLHNPTGATLSPQIAFQLLGIITRADMLVVEDDIFADFEPEPAITLATLDGLSRSSASAAFPRRSQPRCAPASSPPIPSASGS